MKFNKKSEAGLSERIELLMKYNKKSKAIFEEASTKFKRKDVAKDDLIDAICLAVTLSSINSQNKPVSPIKSNTDERGIEMSIHYYNPNDVA